MFPQRRLSWNCLKLLAKIPPSLEGLCSSRLPMLRKKESHFGERNQAKKCQVISVLKVPQGLVQRGANVEKRFRDLRWNRGKISFFLVHVTLQRVRCPLGWSPLVCFSFFLQNAVMTFEEDKMSQSLVALRAMEKRCCSTSYPPPSSSSGSSGNSNISNGFSGMTLSPSFSSFHGMKSKMQGLFSSIPEQQTDWNRSTQGDCTTNGDEVRVKKRGSGGTSISSHTLIDWWKTCASNSA